MSTVQVGQIWADNDWRSAGRTLRVVEIDATHATCLILSNVTGLQSRIDNGLWGARDVRGRTTRIRLDRFRPTSTGYRLIDGATQ